MHIRIGGDVRQRFVRSPTRHPRPSWPRPWTNLAGAGANACRGEGADVTRPLEASCDPESSDPNCVCVCVCVDLTRHEMTRRDAARQDTIPHDAIRYRGTPNRERSQTPHAAERLVLWIRAARMGCTAGFHKTFNPIEN